MSNAGASGRSLALGIVLILLLVVVTVFLFRGSLGQGMQADEVNRVINLIPLLYENAAPIQQSTFSLSVFGLKIPLMYKEYISTAYVLRFLPLAFFDDLLFGLRTLYWLYLVASSIALFLVLRRKSPYLAFFAPLLMVTTPLYYPEIRIGFADSINVLFLVLGCHLISLFLRKPTSRSGLFWGIFLLFFAANQMLYFAWVIAAMTSATLILYPERWFKHSLSLRNWVIFIAAASLGLANFLVYNLSRGFPTVSIFITRIFFPEEYNKNPLDYSKTRPFLEDIADKLSHVPYFLGPYWWFFSAVLLISFLLLIYCIVQGRRERNLREMRIYVLPFLISVLILFFILISPKTSRAGHYAYIIPFLQLAVLTSISLAGGLFKSQRQSRLFLLGIPAMLVGANLLASNQIVTKINQTGGTGLYSPAVFAFNDYLTEQRIDSRNVVFLTWGLHTQPYFLNKGNFQINNMIFSLSPQLTESEKRRELCLFFSSYRAQAGGGDRLYFPLYAKLGTDTNDALIELAKSYDINLKLEKTFKETNGEDVILLYRLENKHVLTVALQEEISSAPASPKIRITRFGPSRESLGRAEDLPMWFIAKGLSPETRVSLGGLLLKTVYSVDHVTALVPWRKIQNPGSYPLFLYDLETNQRSYPVYLEID